MKSVLISIQPKWCHKIIDGEKTIEVRKTKPKLDTPFKVYIYCSAGSYDWRKDPWTTAYFPPNGEITNMSQMVIGEFVCDYICPFFDDKDTCLSNEEIEKYASGKPLYGWHISDLKIYDKPKELSEFCMPCKTSCDDCKKPLFYDCWLEHGKIKKVTRPPQSWMYVEELS